MTKTGKPDKTITIAGQSASGKTNMLASLLFNKNVCADLDIGPDRVDGPVVGPRVSEGKSAHDIDDLRDHYARMISGKEDLMGEGTNEVRRYPSRLSFAVPPASAKQTSTWLNRPKTKPRYVTLDFDIVDGRGNDLASVKREAELDKTERSRRDTYRDALSASTGAIICMSIQREAFSNKVVDKFLTELERMKKQKKDDPSLPRLAHVAICYTFYETDFIASGAVAGELASDRGEFQRRMRDHASRTMFVDFVQSNRGNDRFDLRFFPVSSYGFIRGNGAANFYNYPNAKGLKTRSVDVFDDYNNPELPDYWDHFPYPMTQAEAAELWWPYNLAPPVLFALTGRVTGPLSVTPSELSFQIDEQSKLVR